MPKVCKWFACVYALKNGCVIEGWTGKEGPLNGKKAYCPHYKVMCIDAKCEACGHNDLPDCKEEKQE